MKTAFDTYHPRYASMLRILVEEIHEWMRRVPDRSDGRLWTCHAVARAVMAVWQLPAHEWHLRDGYYLGLYSHSWLEYRPDPETTVILDAYPVGGLDRPIVLDTLRYAMANRHYLVVERLWSATDLGIIEQHTRDLVMASVRPSPSAKDQS